MWMLFQKKFNANVPIDYKSFFCGDSAGRKYGKHKDFNDDDIKFSRNIGLPFKTPENIFLG